MSRTKRWTSAARIAAAAVLSTTAVLSASAPATAAERGIELVSPPDVGAYDAVPMLALPAGGGFYWHSGGAAGTGHGDPAPPDGGNYRDVFLAERGRGGWTSRWLTPDPPTAFVEGPFWPGATAPGLVYGTDANLVPEDQNTTDWLFGTVKDLYRVRDGGPQLLTAPPGGTTGPAGLAHDSIATTPDLAVTAFTTVDPLVAEDTDSAKDVYLRTDGALQLLSRDTSGAPSNGSAAAALAHELSGPDFGRHFPTSQGMVPLSHDGQSVVFKSTAALDPADTDSRDDLYLWRSGTVTFVSDNLVGADCLSSSCAPAFVGMAADASVIYFRTREALLAADADSVDDIYAYRPDAAPGARLSLATPGGASAVQGVSVSERGDLFFTTVDRIGVDPPAAGSTVVIYRWDGAEVRTVSEIAESPTGAAQVFYPSDDDLARISSGGVAASNLEYRPIRATADGDAVVFITAAPLVPEDADAQFDVYLWRAGEGVTLVSAGGGSSHPSVIGPYHAIGMGASAARSIDADASRVYFTSAEVLADGAGDNGRPKVYEWRSDGTISLVSQPGADAGAAWYVDSSASGDDVYFVTRDALVGSDRDGGQRDVYDARVGGGFPEDPPTLGAPPAAGGGSGSVPAGPGTESLNPAPEPPPAQPDPIVEPDPVDEPPADRSARLAVRTIEADGRRFTVPVEVSGRGTVRIVVRSRGKGRSRVLARGRGTVVDEGRVRMRLTKRGVRKLRDGQPHRVVVRLRFKPADGGDRVSKKYRRVTLKRSDDRKDRR